MASSGELFLKLSSLAHWHLLLGCLEHWLVFPGGDAGVEAGDLGSRMRALLRVRGTVMPGEPPPWPGKEPPDLSIPRTAQRFPKSFHS